jgi:hypothetical protein
MKRAACFLVPAMAGLFCAGCWPMHIISSPGASGFVFDRETRGAIGGAQVAVSRASRREWPDYGVPTLDEALENTRPPIVMTDTNGHFSIPPLQEWMKDYPPPEGPARGTLVVRRDGYKPAIIPLMADSMEDVGIVLLTPLAGPR